MPSAAHVVFIPGVLLIGMVLGYILGNRAAREELDRRQKRRRELDCPVMAEWSPQLPFSPGEVLGGKYRVERLLGQGGMGAVVEATHLQLEERVALKVMLASQDERPDAVQRFLREGRAACKIKSEHVARVLDVGTLDSGRPYLVMELLEGEDLAVRLGRLGKLSVSEAVGHLLDACDAIEEAHLKGIVHRDLKPANLFLARRPGGRSCLKVLDFGISKVSGGLSDGLLTSSRTVIGTPFYMAPEQMRSSGQVDGRADVWSLGATLYELLGGEPPFLSDDITVIVARVLHGEPPPLETLRPGLPPLLLEAIGRSLQKNPDQRFPDVASFAAALAPFLQFDATSNPDFVPSLRRSSGSALSGAPSDASSAAARTVKRRPGAWRPVLLGLALLAAAGALALGWRRRAPVATTDSPATASVQAPGVGATGAPPSVGPGGAAGAVSAPPDAVAATGGSTTAAGVAGASGSSIQNPSGLPAHAPGATRPGVGVPAAGGGHPAVAPRPTGEKPPARPSGLPADRD